MVELGIEHLFISNIYNLIYKNYNDKYELNAHSKRK